MSCKPFSLNITDEDFKQRQKNVFDQLGVLENTRTNSMDVDISSNETQVVQTSGFRSENRSDRAYLKQFRGKESIFKKPQNPVTARSFLRRMPDFKKNPHKWTKYSLDDVKDEDISEKGNTKAALSFLKEMENRKIREMKIEKDDNKPPKVTYRKVIVTEAEGNKDNTEDKATFSSSKVVMPEYIVGQKVKKDNVKKGKVEKGKELKLDHLFEEDD